MSRPANDEGTGSSDHRVIDHGSWLGIHEVYYNESGRPTGFTPESVAVIVDAGESPQAVRRTLDQMRGALAKPVLTPGDFLP